MRKLINQPSSIIPEMLEGFLALYPTIALLAPYNVLLRADFEEIRERQVALISGGGSGHEPAHAGYVGAGMLSAAVAGEIFTSPSVESILAAIRAVTGNLGVLLIVKNYTGDRLNFGMAAEIARSEGFLVDTVLVADDVALPGSNDHAGRRGLAGTIFVHKIAGAAAAAGLDLPQVAILARAAAAEVATMGVAISPGINPTFEGPSESFGDEVELGLGIHGERGVRRVPAATADNLIDQLLHGIAAAVHPSAGDAFAVLLNDLGSSTGIELAIAARRVAAYAQSRQLSIARIYAGRFLSSLDMNGLSITFLRVDENCLKWLDAFTAAPAWPNACRRSLSPLEDRLYSIPEHTQADAPHVPSTQGGRVAERAIRHACQALRAAEAQLAELDRAVGDGDLGHNLARAAAALEQDLAFLPCDQFPSLLKALGMKLQRVLGGSSGPLYGVFFLRAGTALEAGPQSDLSLWAVAMLEGCEAVSELGGARLGDCTMLDALVPFARTMQQALHAHASLSESLRSALDAARQGAASTVRLTARRGRASYLGTRSVGHPDPGAIAAVLWLEAVVASVE